MKVDPITAGGYFWGDPHMYERQVVADGARAGHASAEAAQRDCGFEGA
jgi:hypothetical protein